MTIAARPQAIPGPASQTAATSKPDHLLAGYRTWTRVNPKPYLAHPGARERCYVPPEDGGLGVPNPHRDPFYLTVYVNPLGAQAMFAKGVPRFPAGSVVVKEKRRRPEDAKPELMTVMVKHAVGKANGDGWEYLAYDGDGARLPQAGNDHSCQSCHETCKDSGYVFRTYLPR